MEKGYGYTRFFFNRAYQDFDSITRYIRDRFKDLLSDTRTSGQEAFKRSARNYIIKAAENRYNTGITLSKTFATPIERQTIIEYFFLLERFDLMNRPK